MNKKVKIGSGGSGGTVTLKPSDYVAAGGEAKIYVTGGNAYKLYHDPKTKMLPEKKIKELATITNPNIVTPKDIIFDAKDGMPLGYTTRFIDKCEPLVKLFTKTFKNANNISHDMVAALVKKMQLMTMDVHGANCLIVDYNELNVLVEVKSELVPWFIDTDSYATPSYKATAIMDSVRDRRVTKYDSAGAMHYNPDIESDWFSFGVLAFWLYSNIHPFRGRCNQYKPKDMSKQMDDGISVFNKNVRVPPSVNDFSVIPPRHLAWFKDIFENNNRSIPPLPDAMTPVLSPTQIVTIIGTDKLEVSQIFAYADNVMSVLPFMGMNHVVTKKHIYAGKKEIQTWDKMQKLLLCPATDGLIVTAALRGTQVSFADSNGTPAFGTIQSISMFQRNNAIYTMSMDKFIENTFIHMGSVLIHSNKHLENVSITSAKMYEGCVIQDLLGKKYLTIPYATGASFSKHIPALDEFRIIDAKSDKTVTVVLGEKNGKYNRFIIVFDKEYKDFEVREVKDVAYAKINFAVHPGGFCMLLASATELELFIKADKYEIIADPPFDFDMPLFATNDGFFFINNNSIHQVKRK
jgi:hypothetical protein